MAVQQLTIFAVYFATIYINSFAIQNFEYPDYSYEVIKQSKDLRKHFLDRKKEMLLNGRRVELLDRYFSNYSVRVDGVTHHIINEKNNKLKEINEIENNFRNLIEMNGVKYTYKRDSHWRTARKVRFPNGTDQIVCYRCTNSLNSTDCNGGYWIIEEKLPPCPFEIFSVVNDSTVCAINLSISTNVTRKCPSIIPFTDLTINCDNPIKTQWRIMKTYGSEVSERFPEVICNGRDYCEISTVYAISRDYVSFRIVNSSNHLIYSRIMKNGGNNYACVNCGVIDSHTNIIIETEKPTSFDLLKKKKREDVMKVFEALPASTSRPEVPSDEDEMLNSKDAFFYIPPKRVKHNHSFTCQSLKHLRNDDYDY